MNKYEKSRCEPTIIKKVVEGLYLEVLQDDELLSLYENTLSSPVGIINLHQKKYEFLKSIISEDHFDNLNSPQALHPLVTNEITQEKFEIILGHLEDSMNLNKIDESFQAEVLSRIKKTREILTSSK